MIKIIPITNDSHEIIAAEWLLRAESVHRQLRPQLPDDYAARMADIFFHGAEMAVAVEAAVAGGRVLGITVFRIMENTFSGRVLYCDDLVTDAAHRSTGVGRALMQHMEVLARDRGCIELALDSGCQREQAHKFYFREGMAIPSFHFSKPLK